MKKLISIMLLFTALNSYSQNCKYDLNEVDKFTKAEKKEKEIKINHWNFNGDNRVIIKLCRYDNRQFIRISITSKYSMVVGIKDELYLLLENDNVVKLKANNIYSSESYKDHDELYATYNFTELGMKELSDSPIKSVRLYYNTNSYKDINIKKAGMAKDLQKAALCFL